MGDFEVLHDQLREFNDMLMNQAKSIETVLDHLNTALKNIPDAAQGKAAPLWQGEMQNWNLLAQRMYEDFSRTAVVSNNLGDVYVSGDQATARLFL